MLAPPRALQRLGDVVLIVVAVRMAQLREVCGRAPPRGWALKRAQPVTPVISRTTWVSLRWNLFSGFGLG